MEQILRFSSCTGIRALVPLFSRRLVVGCSWLKAPLGWWYTGLLLALILSVNGWAQGSGNLVQNGGFETGDFPPWTTSGDTNLLISIGYPHSGARSLLFGSESALSYVSQNVSTTAGQTYLLSFWVWNEGETPNQFLVEWGGATLLNQQNLVLTAWTNMQFVVNATSASSLLKFGGLNALGYTALDEISVIPPGAVATNVTPVLPSIGPQTIDELTRLTVTNRVTEFNESATITYALLNAPIDAEIDVNGVITWRPDEADGPGNYTITTVATSTYLFDTAHPKLSATNSFNVSVNEVNVAPVLPFVPVQSGNEMTLLAITNTATDSDVPSNALTYELINPPAGVSIDVKGVIHWTPTETQGPGDYVLTTVVTDNGTPSLRSTNAVLVTVNEVNLAPVLSAQTNRSVNELTQLVVNNAGSDSDLPSNVLTYQLLNPPPGAAIVAGTGTITWTPTEAQGPGSVTITTVVTDSGTPNLSTTNTFTVTVNEVNSTPTLPEQADRNVNQLMLLSVTNTATDPDLPANVLSYQLLTGPQGSAISTTGVITWTPTESQGTGPFTFTTVVADNGTPVLRATNSFSVTVNAVNSAPVLPVQADRTVNELVQLTVTNTASDSDIPANLLSYKLVNPPEGAAIDSAGVIRWTPSEAQGPHTYPITTVVTDNGTPVLSATNSFYVTINEVNSAPVLPEQVDRTVYELALLAVTNTATDVDLPPNELTYRLTTGPAGSTIDRVGVITWIPNETQGPGIYTFMTVASDNGNPVLSVTNTFIVTVNESNAPPLLAPVGNKSVRKMTLLTFTVSATDSDIPAQTLRFSLDPGAPTGAGVDPITGVFTWTPSLTQGPSTNSLTIRVTDNAVPPLSGSETFVIVVTESNSPPVLAQIGTKTVNEGNALTFTAAATDPDVPAQILTYSLDVGAPQGATIDPATGLFSWTPGEANGPATNSVMVRVTDNGTPPASASQLVTIIVNEVNRAPVLGQQTNRTINELTQLVVANSASDPDIPANVLSYQLISPPAGAAIDGNGVIIWTPSQAQGPGTYVLTTVVTDSGTPPLSATNAFTVIVNDLANSAPILSTPVLTSSTVTISWTAISGKTYRVQYTSDLKTNSWLDLAGDITATGSTASKTDNRSATLRFYRVQLLP